MALGAVVIGPLLLLAALLGNASSTDQWLIAITGRGQLPEWWTALIAALLTGLVSAALLVLARMLAFVERGEPFVPAATRCFRRFAQLMLLAVATAVFLPLLSELAVAIAQQRGRVVLTIEASDLLWLFLTLLFFLVARLFDRAAHYEADSRAIV